MKNNGTELVYQMHTHELWFMLWGLEEYLKIIKGCCDAPDYKLMMISTALRTCEKLRQWAIVLDWNTIRDLERIKLLEEDLFKERKKQDKKWKKLEIELRQIREAKKRQKITLLIHARK